VVSIKSYINLIIIIFLLKMCLNNKFTYVTSVYTRKGEENKSKHNFTAKRIHFFRNLNRKIYSNGASKIQIYNSIYISNFINVTYSATAR
jgi:hypothetical protein